MPEDKLAMVEHMKMMDMPVPKELVVELCQQAIEAEEKRIGRIEKFLETHPLDTDVNKTVALELGTCIMFIEKDIEKLKNAIKKEEN